MIPQSSIETFAFLSGWFAIDIVWLAATVRVMPSRERNGALFIVVAESLILLSIYRFTHSYLDIDDQCAAYWYGIGALFMDALGSLALFCKEGNTDGISGRLV